MGRENLKYYRVQNNKSRWFLDLFRSETITFHRGFICVGERKIRVVSRQNAYNFQVWSLRFTRYEGEIAWRYRWVHEIRGHGRYRPRGNFSARFQRFCNFVTREIKRLLLDKIPDTKEDGIFRWQFLFETVFFLFNAKM